MIFQVLSCQSEIPNYHCFVCPYLVTSCLVPILSYLLYISVVLDTWHRVFFAGTVEPDIEPPWVYRSNRCMLAHMRRGDYEYHPSDVEKEWMKFPRRKKICKTAREQQEQVS